MPEGEPLHETRLYEGKSYGNRWITPKRFLMLFAGGKEFNVADIIESMGDLGRCDEVIRDTA